MPQARSPLKAEPLKVAALALALCACDSKHPALSGGHEPNGPLATDNALAPETANSAAAAAAGEAGTLPPPGPIARFVGKWATDQKSCSSAAWQFTASALHTPTGADCSFDQVTDVPGGYNIHATCTAKGPPTTETIQVRFAESAKAMMFTSKSVGDTGLVYCGRDA